MPLGERRELGMIGDDRRDFDGEIAGTVAVQEIVETMVGFRTMISSRALRAASCRPQIMWKRSAMREKAWAKPSLWRSSPAIRNTVRMKNCSLAGSP